MLGNSSASILLIQDTVDWSLDPLLKSNIFKPPNVVVATNLFSGSYLLFVSRPTTPFRTFDSHRICKVRKSNTRISPLSKPAQTHRSSVLYALPNATAQQSRVPFPPCWKVRFCWIRLVVDMKNCDGNCSNDSHFCGWFNVYDSFTASWIPHFNNAILSTCHNFRCAMIFNTSRCINGIDDATVGVWNGINTSIQSIYVPAKSCESLQNISKTEKFLEKMPVSKVLHNL